MKDIRLMKLRSENPFIIKKYQDLKNLIEYKIIKFKKKELNF